MKKRKTFETPRVLKRVPVELEQDLLGASVRFTINSMGQAVETHDFSDGNEDDYVQYWE